MAIRVTCAKCLTRFNVSDQFAGQKGPCPKCKTTIEIPKANEEVVVHGPDTFGPKGADGKGVLEPVFREEKPVSLVTWVLSGAIVLVILILSILGRFQFPEPQNFPLWAMGLGAALASFPVCFLAYQLLYNREGAAYTGGELFTRVGITALSCAALWILSPIVAYAMRDQIDNPGAVSQGIAVFGLIAGGAAVAMLAFDFDYFIGLVVSGIYVVVCLLMRVIAGLPAFPGMNADPEPKKEKIEMVLQMFDQFAAMIGSLWT